MADSKKTIDLNFYLPPELVGFEYDIQAVDEDDYSEETEAAPDQPDDDKLQPPSNIKIIKQTVTTKKDKQFIDVVIQISDDDKDGYTYATRIKKETLADDPDSYSVDQNEDV